MSVNQKKTLTTGQLAKLHQINNRTLHYYDSIGLFSPNEIGENKYRYYTLDQVGDLELILAFRELGMSIDEIKKAVYGDEETMDRIVTDKIRDIDEKMKSLTNMKRLLQAKQKLAALSRESKTDEIEIVHCPREQFVLSSSLEGVSDESYYLTLVDMMRKESHHRLFNNNYGIMISSDKIWKGNYEDYDCYYIKPYEKGRKKLFVRPEGEYLRIVCKGNWDRLPWAYEKIRNYARDHGLELTGYAFERSLNETLSTNMDRYVTEIIVRFKE